MSSARDISLLAPHMAPLVDSDTELTYVPQPEPSGTADAIRRGLVALRTPQAFVLFGDNVFAGSLPDDLAEPLDERSDIRCFVRWADDDIGQLAVVQVERDGDRSHLARRPHNIQAGYALTGLFAIKANALATFTSGNRPDSGEDDILDFVSFCLSHGRCDLRVINTEWCDAGYSAEALWRASMLVRGHC